MSRARAKFSLFIFLNIISFSLLGENIITLYSLRLGAENFLIGLLSSFLYMAFFFMLIGRYLAPKMGMVRLMGRFWFIRYLLMIPILFSPILAGQGFQEAALALIVISVLGFHVSRGIAVTGYNPIVGEITAEKDRGAFLARLQMINHTGTLAAGLAMAFLLGKSAPLYIYSLFIIAGIIFGLTASFMIFKLPEPGKIEQSFSENLWRGFWNAFKRKTFKKFIIVQFLTLLATFMVTPFLIVYMQRVYQQTDSNIILFTVSGSLGAIFMALVSGFMIDKLGAKPLFFIFAGILTLTLIAIIIFPALLFPARIFVFAALVFFFINMGRFGILNAGQTYFFSAINPEERLNLGVIFFLTQGLAGWIGSLMGGTILTGLQVIIPENPGEVFKLYFGLVAVLFILILYFITTMDNIGAYPIRNVLAIIFSPRDLRAISLLHRLRKSRDLSEEKRTIRAIAESPSELSVQEILQKLSSPRFTIRSEALAALNKLPADEAVAQALISEVKNHSFTTAYLAAETLGRKQIKGGIRILRRALKSRDFFLSGKCMVSLARLNDRESIPDIEAIVLKTNNPRLIIHGAAALAIFKSTQSFPVLLSKLEKKTSPFLRDEIILSMAGILEIENWFYPYYVAFLEKSTTGISMLKDFLAASHGCSSQDKIEQLLVRMPGNREDFAGLAGELLHRLRIELDGIDISSLIGKAVSNPRLNRLDRFRFLVAAVIIWFACRTSPAS